MRNAASGVRVRQAQEISEALAKNKMDALKKSIRIIRFRVVIFVLQSISGLSWKAGIR